MTPSSPSPIGTLTCNQFNPAQGNLYRYAIVALDANTGPNIGLTGSTMTLQNNSASSYTVNTGQFVDLIYTLSYSGFPGQSTMAMNFPLMVSTGATIPVGGSGTITLSAATIPIGRTGQTASLASYIGTGTFNASYTVSSAFSNLPAGVTATNYSITGNGALTIVYEFDPPTTSGIPEPSAVTLGAGGLVAMIAMARRHKRG